MTERAPRQTSPGAPGRRWPRAAAPAAAGIAAIVIVASPGWAYQAPPEVVVSTGVSPAEVTVGDTFRVRLRVDAPADVAVEFAERPAATADLEPLGPVTVHPGDPGEPYVADYALVAWTTGELERPVVPVFVRDAAGAEFVVRVRLPLARVRSVLPVGDDLPEPRPPRGVLEAPGRSWWWLLGVLAALLLTLAWLARRRPAAAPEAAALAMPPRQQALQRLEEARRLGLAEAGEWKAFYSRVSDALRGYLAAIGPGWGGELTTTELVAAAESDGLPFDQVRRLAALLERADRVKFAQVRPGPAAAEHDWAEARRLVEELEPVAAVSRAGAEAVAS